MAGEIKFNDKYKLKFNTAALIEMEETLGTNIFDMRFDKLKIPDFLKILRIAIKGGSGVELTDDELLNITDEIGLANVFKKINEAYLKALGADINNIDTNAK
jgi:hypothetical protein